MFEMGSASIGTTTTGADLSPLIPSQEWAQIISQKIGQHVADPKENYPMFLVDSEGIGQAVISRKRITIFLKRYGH